MSERKTLAALKDLAASFEPRDTDSFTAEHGWRIDDYSQPLGEESPGEPQPSDRWETAKRLMQDYEFADPKIIRATYERDGPLKGREMLLEARFWGLRFHFGVRVSGVIDESREVEERQVRVWGWCYRTLKGHLETGQMSFEVWKWKDTGEVEFRIHSISRAGRIQNPVTRLGFRLFGRGQQVKFCRHACERMQRLTQERLEAGADTRLSGAGKG